MLSCVVLGGVDWLSVSVRGANLNSVAGCSILSHFETTSDPLDMPGFGRSVVTVDAFPSQPLPLPECHRGITPA